jgi:hypothetical protein
MALSFPLPLGSAARPAAALAQAGAVSGCCAKAVAQAIQ